MKEPSKMKEEILQVLHTTLTASATGITVATILGWLPSIAALLGIIWYVILIIEKRTNKPMHIWFRKKDTES